MGNKLFIFGHYRPKVIFRIIREDKGCGDISAARDNLTGEGRCGFTALYTPVPYLIIFNRRKSAGINDLTSIFVKKDISVIHRDRNIFAETDPERNTT